MTDFDEMQGENVHKETANELIGGEGHDFPLVVVPVVAPFESDVAIFYRNDAVVGNGNPVGITTEILDDAGGGLEGRFAVCHPIFFEQSFYEIGEVSGVVEIRGVIVEIKFSSGEEIQKLAAKLFREHPDGNKKLFSGVEPVSGWQQTTGRNDTMNMRVVGEILTPSVQNSSETELSAEILFVGGKLL